MSVTTTTAATRTRQDDPDATRSHAVRDRAAAVRSPRSRGAGSP